MKIYPLACLKSRLSKKSWVREMQGIDWCSYCCDRWQNLSDDNYVSRGQVSISSEWMIELIHLWTGVNDVWMIWLGCYLCTGVNNRWVGGVVGQSAAGRGGDSQGRCSWRCNPHHWHCPAWGAPLHVALWTQADGTLWTSWFRQDHDALQCSPSSSWSGG